MYDIKLEPWESISDLVKSWLPHLEQRKYPKLDGEPEIGKACRLYPDGCLAGNCTPYHGTLRLGEDQDKVIVYFNGGGVSWNEYTAAHPNGLFNANQKDRYYFNECEWLGDGVIDNGLASRREDNPFRSWTVIDLPYTTGDFHCGNGDFPYTALDDSRRILPHHGYRNTMAVLEMAKHWVGTPQKLLIAGSSAGGWGVSLMAEDVIRFFDGCEDITCLVDSSLLFKKDWADIARNVWKAPAHICDRIISDNIMLDSYTALYNTFGNKIRYLFDCSIRDVALVMTQNEFDGNGMTPSKESGILLQKNLKKLYKQMTEKMPGFGCFFFDLPSGNAATDSMGLTLHTILESPLQFEHMVEGETISSWLWKAVNGEVKQIGMNQL